MSPTWTNSISKAPLRLITIAILLANNADCYNVEVNTVGVFRGEKGSQFGYTVALFREPGSDGESDFYPKMLLVGAPNTTYSGIKGYGQLYGCARPMDSGENCQILNITEKSNMCERLRRDEELTHCEEDSRLGATLKVNRKNPTVVTVCAPGWKNVYPETKSINQNYMIGLCLQLRGDLTPPDDCRHQRDRCWPFWPGKDTTFANGRPVFACAQGGMSAAYTQDGNEVISGPGVDDWRGAFSIPAKDLVRRRSWDQKDSTLYFGYAIATGIFEKGNIESIVAGIPNWYNFSISGHLGRVELYHGIDKWAVVDYGIPLQCTGRPRKELDSVIDAAQTGTKFGATLETVDLNGDGLDELLIGAPLYTGERPDEGRVFIYSSTNDQSTICGPIAILSGAAKIDSLKGGAANARFGTSIADAGDLDLDGYKDIAIGAPYENDGVGVIYIYNGNIDTGGVVEDSFAQRIAGKDIDIAIKSFGWSLFGNEDVDDNSFPDLAVGAYMSDTAIVLRSRPIVKVMAEATAYPNTISYKGYAKRCSLDLDSHCFELTVVFKYDVFGTRKGNFDDITIALHLDLDADNVKAVGYSRAIFWDTGVPEMFSQNITLGKSPSGTLERKYMIEIKGHKDSNEPKDVWTPVRIVGSLHLLNENENDFATVKPILHKDSDRSIYTEVLFDNECNSTDGCASDLNLAVNMFLLDKYGQAIRVKEGTTLYVGAANELNVIAKVRNDLHTSYNAALTGTVTAVVSRDHLVDTIDNVVTCEHDYTTSRHYDITCQANRKLLKDECFKIKSRFDVTQSHLVPDFNIGNMQDSLTISFNTYQANLDINAYNNVIERRINVKLNYDLLLEVEKSSKVFVHSTPGTGNQRITLLHKFYITNQGPSFLPMTYVSIYVPVIKGDKVIADVKGVDILPVNLLPFLYNIPSGAWSYSGEYHNIFYGSINVSENCYITAGMSRDSKTTSNDEKSITPVLYDDPIADGRKEKRISCLNSECLVIECKVTTLRALHRKSMEVTIDVLKSEVATGKDADAVTYTTSASVTDPVIWYGSKVVPFQKALYIEKTTEFAVQARPKIEVLKNEELQDGTGSQKAVQLAPQHVKLNLKPGEQSEVLVKYRPLPELPTDIYFVMDYTITMAWENNKITENFGKNIDLLRKSITNNIQVGFGSFVDKPVHPFTITTPQQLENLCIAYGKKCDPPYGYIHRLHLSEDIETFVDTVKATNFSLNYDPIEGGLDAVVQASVCPNIIGWRNQTRRVLVYISDSGFHFAGDAKLGGIDKPNDVLCHLAPYGKNTEEYIYTHSKVTDYPSFGQVKKALKDNKISSLFLVDESDKVKYKGLTDFIGDHSSTEQLTNDSMIVYRFIEGLAKRLNMVAENMPEGLDVKAETNCNNDLKSVLRLLQVNVQRMERERAPSDWKHLVSKNPFL